MSRLIKLFEEFVNTMDIPRHTDTLPIIPKDDDELMRDDEEASKLLGGEPTHDSNVKFDGNVYTITNWSVY